MLTSISLTLLSIAVIFNCFTIFRLEKKIITMEQNALNKYGGDQ